MTAKGEREARPSAGGCGKLAFRTHRGWKSAQDGKTQPRTAGTVVECTAHSKEWLPDVDSLGCRDSRPAVVDPEANDISVIAHTDRDCLSHRPVLRRIVENVDQNLSNGTGIAVRNRRRDNVDFDPHLASLGEGRKKVGRGLRHSAYIDGSRLELDVGPRRSHDGIGQRDQTVRFSLDYLQGAFALGFRARAPEAKQLHEHQDLL